MRPIRPTGEQILKWSKSHNAAIVEMVVEDAVKVSTNTYLQLNVARNPAASANILLILAQRGNHEVRREVLKNPNCPPELRALLAIAPAGAADE